MSTTRDDSSGFHVTLSTNVAEADASARLAHDGYVESGFIEPRPSGRRFVGPYLNPGTSFGVCRSGQKDAGTGVAIMDGPFGVASDRVFPDLMNGVREAGDGVIFEASTLVVPRQWRKSGRRIITLLLATLVHVAAGMPPTAQMVLTLHPRDTRFWSSTFGLQRISDEPRDLWGAPGELVAASCEQVLSGIFNGTRRLQKEIAQAVVDPDASWFTDARGPEPLPREWFEPLSREDPELTSLRARMSLLEPTGAGSAVATVLDPASLPVPEGSEAEL